MSERRERAHVSYGYGVANLLSCVVYAVLFFWLAPSRSATWNVVALVTCFVCFAGALGMVVPRAWGRQLAVAAGLALLGLCVVVIGLLVASAAYLHGIYGGVGQAGTVIAVVAAALSVELFGLLPALQLAHIVRATRGAVG